MEIENFGKRLAELRAKKNVSARDMSLSLGMGLGYINNIENGKNFPSMEVFFYICEYLEISPSDFFNEELSNPAELNEVIDDLKKLNSNQLEAVKMMVKQIK